MKIASCHKLYDVRFKKIPVTLPRTEDGPHSPISVSGQMVYDTVCVISEENQNLRGPERFTAVAEGTAYMSHKDRYNRWKGKKVALGRALQQLTTDDDTRVAFWDSFFNNFPKARPETLNA